MKRAEKNAKKLAVLEVINSKKDILFASVQNIFITKKQKEEGWKEVLAMAKSVGMVSPHRTWTFVRDNIFGLWKSRTLAKLNRLNGLGRRSIDVVDKAILDIIEIYPSPDEELNSQHQGMDNVKGGVPSLEVNSDVVKSGETTPKKRKSQARAEGDESILRLKKELLRIEIYKTKLEALKLERDLHLPSSEYTEGLN